MNTTAQKSGAAFNEAVSWRIRQRRRELGMTPEELGREAGMDASLVMQIENGSFDIELWMLASLVPPLRVTPSYLLGLCSHPYGISSYLWE